MCIQGFSKELGRPDVFRCRKAGRSRRQNKLPARKLAVPVSQGRLEVRERTRNKEAQRGNELRPKRIAARTSIRSRSS